MNINTIKALTFDTFGTVVDWRSSIIRQLQTFGDDKGFDIDWTHLTDAWRGLYQPAMEKVRNGEIAWQKLDDLHRMNLDQLLDQFGITGLCEKEKDHLNRVWHRLDPWPDATEGMSRLRQRFIIAALSNGNIALMVNMAKRAALPWDVILGAEVAGHYKPQPQAYLKTADFLGLQPAQCMMVAAHNSDLIAAESCGFHTAFVYRRQEYGPAQTTDQEPTRNFDVIAEDFLDLARQLGC